MFTELLRVQWLRVRAVVVIAALLLFTLPLLIVRGGIPDDMNQVGWWLHNAELLGRAVPVVALFFGLYLGVTAWSDDVQGKHVYALSLPLPRERYVLYRFVALAVPLLVPALALLAGALIASATVTLPSGVHAYPVALAVRAFLAMLVSYAIFFTIAVATRRAVLIVLGVILGAVALDLVFGLLEVEASALDTIARLLTTWPGPLAILGGRWALFDV